MHTGILLRTCNYVNGTLGRRTSIRTTANVRAQKHLNSCLRGERRIHYVQKAAFLTSVVTGRVFRPRVDHRGIAWKVRATLRPRNPEDISQREEDEAKSAILEKVMKGRQPTDLMLRYKHLPHCLLVCFTMF